MNARYSKIKEGNNFSGKKTCIDCNKFDWFIIIERAGNNSNFEICQHCGGRVK